MAEATKSITLSNGRTVQVRSPKGRDSNRAWDVVGEKASKFKFTCALLAQISTIDGKPCVFEDIQELLLSDIDIMASAVASFTKPRMNAERMRDILDDVENHKITVGEALELLKEGDPFLSSTDEASRSSSSGASSSAN